MQPPYDYNTQTAWISKQKPGTVHTKNTAMYKFYQRYLFQKLTSQFKWSLPDGWDESYFVTCLYGNGHLAVFNTPKYGTVCQAGTTTGYDIYYQPTRYVIANPLIHGTEYRIGDTCEIIKLQRDYMGALDLVNYYADMLSTCAETLAMNVMNCKLSYVFGAGSKSAAETGKKMFDQMQAGNLAVWVDKDMVAGLDGKPTWQPFTLNVRQNFISPELVDVMQAIESEFCRRVGIPAITEKRERMITDEAKKDLVETDALVAQWHDTINSCLETVNDRFGLDIACNRRYMYEGGDILDGDAGKPADV